MGKTNLCNHRLSLLQHSFMGRHRLHFHPIGLSLAGVRAGNDYRSCLRTQVKIDNNAVCVLCILIVNGWHSLYIVTSIQLKLTCTRFISGKGENSISQLIKNPLWIRWFKSIGLCSLNKSKCHSKSTVRDGGMEKRKGECTGEIGLHLLCVSSSCGILYRYRQ